MVSVVIPYFNRRDTILRAVESAVNQTVRDMEILLVDDGSTDDTTAVVEEYLGGRKDVSYKIVKQDNRGPGAARNAAIRMAKGEYIAFLDSDDSWELRKLEVQLAIARETDADLVSCNANIVLPHGTRRKTYTLTDRLRIDHRWALFKYYTSTPCVLARKKAIERNGCFPEDARIGEDIQLYYRIIRSGECYVSAEYLTNIHKELYGFGGLSKSLRNSQEAIRANIHMARKENDKYDKRVGLGLYLAALTVCEAKYLLRIILSYRNRIERALFSFSKN